MAQSLESKLPIAGLLTLIGGLVAALIWNKVPLDPGRPPAEAIDQHHQPQALQVIDARLWEDSLLVLARHQREPRVCGAIGARGRALHAAGCAAHRLLRGRGAEGAVEGAVRGLQTQER